MTKFTILGGAALLAMTAAAFAQPPGGPDGPRRDRNADFSRAQMIERVDQRFARLDANHDGRFTPEEARAHHQQRRAARREQRADRMFERLDLDRNGSITREEVNQARERHRSERAERGAGMRGPGMRGAGMRHRRMGMRHFGRGYAAGRMFGEQGFVTAEQFRARALARFDRLDADRNGVVTAAERQTAREQRRERRHEGRRRTG